MDSPSSPAAPASRSGTPADALEDLSRALRRGEDVLGAWYREAYPRVLRLARGFLAHRADAEDVAQDAMLHLVDHLDRWDPERSFAAWQRTVVLNRCRNQSRAAARRKSHEDVAGAERGRSTLPSPEEAVLAGELGTLIDRALGVLPPREREVFVLVDLEGSTTVEAAEVLEVAASTVRAALSLARRRLRDALSPHLAEGGLA